MKITLTADEADGPSIQEALSKPRVFAGLNQLSIVGSMSSRITGRQKVVYNVIGDGPDLIGLLSEAIECVRTHERRAEFAILEHRMSGIIANLVAKATGAEPDTITPAVDDNGKPLRIATSD